MSSPCGDIKGFDDERRLSGVGEGGRSNTTRSLSVPPSNLMTTKQKQKQKKGTVIITDKNALEN